MSKDGLLEAKITDDGRDKRRHERLRLDAKLRYKIINRKSAEDVVGTPATRIEGQTMNISVSGLSIATETPLTKGDYLKVELSLPGMGRPTRALAEVVWQRDEIGTHTAGIRFLIILNEADDSSIRRFVESTQTEG